MYALFPEYAFARYLWTLDDLLECRLSPKNLSSGTSLAYWCGGGVRATAAWLEKDSTVGSVNAKPVGLTATVAELKVLVETVKGGHARRLKDFWTRWV